MINLKKENENQPKLPSGWVGWLVVLFILPFYLGYLFFYWVWRNKDFSKRTKIIITFLVVLFFLVISIFVQMDKERQMKEMAERQKKEQEEQRIKWEKEAEARAKIQEQEESEKKKEAEAVEIARRANDSLQKIHDAKMLENGQNDIIYDNDGKSRRGRKKK